jgi:beta-lactam-binding protein with PASTA domain
MRGTKSWTVVLLCIACSVATSIAMYLVVGGTLPAPTDVPTLIGLNVEQARKLSDSASLLLRFEGERVPDNDQIPPGTVLEQKPLGGSRVRTGEVVYATLAMAPQKVRVPVLIEQTVDAARQTLEELGLRVGRVTETVSPTVAPGQVLDSRPAPGSDVRKGEVVHLIVSKASESTVPSVRGMSAGGAKAAIEKAGFQLGERRFGVDDNAADGVVLRQSPAPGTQAPRGAKIDIVVNQ